MIQIGVDLGGTKIEAAAFEAGQELLRRRIATPQGDYAAVVVAVRDLVLGLEREIGRTATVGIGTPGAVSPGSGLIKNSNSTALNGKPFVQDAASALARPVRVANDANCFALSEAIDGAGAGHRTVFGVILGTGVGGGLVLADQLWSGRNAIAGEWGHMEMPRRTEHDLPVRRCYCGRQNCVETFLSGPAVALEHRHRTGLDLDTETIAAMAKSGDADAADTIENFYRRLARALAGVINVVDPDIVVLGGGLSNIDDIYASVPPMLAEQVFSDTFSTPIVKNVHGDSSGVRGAARLWDRALLNGS
jgi:predicted NBD/HSP70 family sugar kinase